MPRKKIADNKNRINSKKSVNYRSKNQASKRREMIIKKRKKNRRITLLILFVVIIAFSIIFYLSRKKTENLKDTSSIGRYYTESGYSDKYNQFNDNLYYKKYKYESGKYNLVDNANWEIKNKYNGSYEYYLWDKLQLYLDENDLSQDDFSLSIKQGDDYVLSLNSSEEYTVDIIDIPYLLMIRDNIESNIVNLEDSIAMISSDLKNGSNIYFKNAIGSEFNIEKIIRETIELKDLAAKNMLNRYLIGKNISLENYLNEKLGKLNTEKYTTTDMIRLIELYDTSNSIINSLFNNIFNNSDGLFTNSIYSSVGNINKSINDKELKYEMGIVNSDTKFYYSIYSTVLSQKQIQEIGDIVNRTVSEINLIRNIQN